MRINNKSVNLSEAISAINNIANIDFDESKFEVTQTASGIYITLVASNEDSIVPSTTDTIKKPFDFDSFNSYTEPTDSSSESSNSEDDWTIALQNNGGDYICRILGSQQSLIAGDNCYYDATTDRWLFNTTGASWYIYLALDRKNSTATIHANDFFPDFRSVAGDHKEYISYKLLYIYDGVPFEALSSTYLIDARHQYEIEGMT